MTKKRLTAFLLALCMMLSLLPDVGWAADPVKDGDIDESQWYTVRYITIDGLTVTSTSTSNPLIVKGDFFKNVTKKDSCYLYEEAGPTPDLEFNSSNGTLTLSPHQGVTVTDSSSASNRVGTIKVNSSSRITFNLTNISLEKLEIGAPTSTKAKVTVETAKNIDTVTLENAEVELKKGTFTNITVSDATTVTIGGDSTSNVKLSNSTIDPDLANKVTISSAGANVTLQNISSTTATVDVTENATVVLNNVTLNGKDLKSAPLKIDASDSTADPDTKLTGARITLKKVVLGNADSKVPGLEVTGSSSDATITLNGVEPSTIQGGIGRAGLECMGTNSVTIRGGGKLTVNGGRGEKATGAAVTAYGGAGIGGRGNDDKDTAASNGKITIKGACMVTATGYDGGAGIGNGGNNQKTLGDINFLYDKMEGDEQFSPVITADAKLADKSSVSVQIGASIGQGGKAITTGEKLDPAEEMTPDTGWYGLIITREEAVVKNDMTLYQSPVNLNVKLTIDAGKSLTIGHAEANPAWDEPEYNGQLIIGEGQTVSANGGAKIRISEDVKGGIKSAITNNGTIYVDSEKCFVSLSHDETVETAIKIGRDTVEKAIYNEYDIPFYLKDGEFAETYNPTDKFGDDWHAELDADEKPTLAGYFTIKATKEGDKPYRWVITDASKIPTDSTCFDAPPDSTGKTQEFTGWYDAQGNLSYPTPGDTTEATKYTAEEIYKLSQTGFTAGWSRNSIVLTLDPDVSAGGSLKRNKTDFPSTGPDNYKFDSATEKVTVNMQELDYEKNEDGSYKSEDEDGNPTGNKGRTTSLKALLESYFTGPESKNGKFFLGWRNDTTREIVDEETKIFYDKDTTFTAQWTTGYQIHFDVNGGQFVDDKGEPVGEKPTVKDGYTSENFTLTATQLEAAGIKNNPWWNSHTFLGWYRYKDWNWKDDPNGPPAPIDDNKLQDDAIEKNSMLSSGEILYAKWHDGYKITFELGDGASFKKPDDYKDFYTDVSTDKVKNPLPTNDNVNRTGYILTGWEYVESTDADGNETRKDATNDTKFEGPTTLFAKWQKQKVEITLDLVKNITDVKLPTNNKVVLNVTTPVGTSNTLGDQYPRIESNQAIFGGWYLDPDKDDRPVRPGDPAFTDNTTIYAHWKAPYQITFDPNGGTLTGEKTMKTDADGRLEKLPAAPTHKTSSFTAWVTTVRDENGKDVEVEVTAGEEGTEFDGPTTVTAKWGAPYYIIYENSEGRYTLDEESVPHWTNDDGTLPELPTPMPTTKGDLFDGWFTDPDCKIPADSQFTATKGPVTLYAKWAITYDITLDANLGKINGKEKITVKTDRDGKIPDLDTYIPIRDQSEFKGWYTRDEHGNEGVQVTKDYQFKFNNVTIYAKWEKTPPYKITFDANNRDGQKEHETPEMANGNAVFPNTNEKTLILMTDDWGVLKELPVEPVSRNQGFLGWYTLPVDGVKIEIRNENGKITVYETSNPSNPTEYKFTDDTTFYAHWSSDEFSVILDFNVSAIPNAPDELSLSRRSTTVNQGLVYLPRVAFSDKSGNFMYVMDVGTANTGWFMEKEGGAEVRAINPFDNNNKSDYTRFEKGRTIYAHWKALGEGEVPDKEFDQYASVKFYTDQDFSALPYMIVMTETSGKLFVVPNPPADYTVNGEEFGGWYYKDANGDEQKITEDTRFTEDVIAYAKWNKSYTITFNPNGGRVSPSTMTTKNLMLKDLPVPEYIGEDGTVYEFEGWYTGDSATDVYGKKVFSVKDAAEDVSHKTTATVFHENTTVYARWKGITSEKPGEDDEGVFTIRFNPNGEGATVSPGSAKTKNGLLDAKDIPEPTWEGHTFDGWYTSATGGSKISSSYEFIDDTTVYAHWTSNTGSDANGIPPFTITFDPAGGRVAITTDVTDANGRLYSLPAAQRTGYVLEGWYLGSTLVNSAYTFTADSTLTAQWKTETIGSGSGSNGDTYSITLNASEGGLVTTPLSYAAEGVTVTLTVRPASGYQLDTLEVTNNRGRDISVRSLGGNRYSFVMPASRVYVDASFSSLSSAVIPSGSLPSGTYPSGTYPSYTYPSGSSSIGSSGTTGVNGVFSQPVLNTLPMPFLDVRPSDWYYSSVDYLWRRDLIGGVTATQFGPQSTTSNAMIWTVLARLAGVDVTTGGTGIWYQQAQSWAVSRGISDGMDPNSAVTREQLATMLWRYSGSPSASYDLGQFGDRVAISSYQSESALRWAVANGIVTGTSNGNLNPRGTATRAEVAAMLTRFCQR